MISLKMKVRFNDGTEKDTVAIGVNEVAFERHFKCSFIEKFSDAEKIYIEHVYWLAWHTCRTTVAFDDWLETVAEIAMEQSVPVDPTSPVPLDGS